VVVGRAVGPEGGNVRGLAIDPTTPTTLYAGTAGGGVFAIEQVQPSLTPTPTATPAVTPSATPTPTVTPTQTPTLTSQAGGGDGGCTMAPRDNNGATWWLLVPALPLLRARRSVVQ